MFKIKLIWNGYEDDSIKTPNDVIKYIERNILEDQTNGDNFDIHIEVVGG